MTDLNGAAPAKLRVAIIGSGPSGFYAADALEKQKDFDVQIDMFERLPTPHGLVRGGVAPDHQKIKSVTKLYDRIAGKDNVRYFGNVEYGIDLSHADLEAHYHAVIYAVGAQTDKSLGIPGEDLPGSRAATEFVAWYNAHPDYRDLSFNLDAEAVAVIGVGNVAMDVTRMLAHSQTELMETDVADYALEALAKSNVKRIYVLGRRGPAQAAFTNPEIKELGELEETDLIVAPEQAQLDALSQAYIDSDDAEPKDVKNVAILQAYAQQKPKGKPKQIIMKFLTSPIEIIGADKVEAIRVVKNELYLNDRGVLRPRATEETEIIPVQLVFRSVGYRGVPLPDVPFYDKWGVIPNNMGRVMTDMEGGEQVTGEYVVGWIKRGPSGVIGTNKPDSVETVEKLLEDAQAGKLHAPTQTSNDAIINLLQSRDVDFVTYDDWLLLDTVEKARGEELGRPRLKFSRVEDMLAQIKALREATL